MHAAVLENSPVVLQHNEEGKVNLMAISRRSHRLPQRSALARYRERRVTARDRRVTRFALAVSLLPSPPILLLPLSLVESICLAVCCVLMLMQHDPGPYYRNTRRDALGEIQHTTKQRKTVRYAY